MSIESLEHFTGWDCLHGALEEIRASHGDCEKFFAEMIDQLDAMSAELCARAKGLAQIAAEECLQNAAAAESREEQIAEQIQQMTQQQSLLEQERAKLESELEAVRQRAAETAESLAEQKRLSEKQQSFWAGELRRMGCLLESMPQRLAEIVPAREPVLASVNTASGATEPEPRRKAGGQQVAAAAADPVLDSVVAQFEILQKDLARRRASA